MPMKVVTVKMEEEIVEKIDRIAKMKGITRSEFIRRAVEAYLKTLSSDMVDLWRPKIIKIYS